MKMNDMKLLEIKTFCDWFVEHNDLIIKNKIRKIALYSPKENIAYKFDFNKFPEIKDTIKKWFSECANEEEAFWLSMAIRDFSKNEAERLLAFTNNSNQYSVS